MNPQQSSRKSDEIPVITIMKSRPNRPYLFIDVVVNQNPHPETKSISVYEGDKAEDLAQDFIDKHCLDESIIFDLTKMIQDQMEMAKS